ncbi:MAG: hypothetical protein ACSHX3_07280 [Litorimonas sp.]
MTANRRFQIADLTLHIDKILIFGGLGYFGLSTISSFIMIFGPFTDGSLSGARNILMFSQGVLWTLLHCLAIIAVGGLLRMGAVFVLAIKDDEELLAALGPSLSERARKRVAKRHSQIRSANAQMQPDTQEPSS